MFPEILYIIINKQHSKSCLLAKLGHLPYTFCNVQFPSDYKSLKSLSTSPVIGGLRVRIQLTVEFSFPKTVYGPGLSQRLPFLGHLPYTFCDLRCPSDYKLLNSLCISPVIRRLRLRFQLETKKHFSEGWHCRTSPITRYCISCQSRKSRVNLSNT